MREKMQKREKGSNEMRKALVWYNQYKPSTKHNKNKGMQRKCFLFLFSTCTFNYQNITLFLLLYGKIALSVS